MCLPLPMRLALGFLGRAVAEANDQPHGARFPSILF